MRLFVHQRQTHCLMYIKYHLICFDWLHTIEMNQQWKTNQTHDLLKRFFKNWQSIPLLCIYELDTLGTKVRGHDPMHFDTMRCATILLRRVPTISHSQERNHCEISDRYDIPNMNQSKETMNKKHARRGFPSSVLCIP